MAEQLPRAEWLERYQAALGGGPIGSLESWAERALDQLIAAGLSPEQVAASVLERERLFLYGDPSTPARPAGLIRATR
ncbi:hypothetical protein ACM792_28180 [Metapseudomonas otitidis]|uniref:hypothetical protein n=1 Tax=Metapseudomonas otitidis TaxID=319939 RepID=UPI0039FB89BB